MLNPRFVARYLAETLANGAWKSSPLVNRSAKFFGHRWRWLRPLVKRLLEEFPGAIAPSRHEVERFLLCDKRFLRACQESSLQVCIDFDSAAPPTMLPMAGRPESWKVPAIVTARQLAEFLDEPLRQLFFLADRHDWQRTVPPGPLRHYGYYWQAKRTAGSARLIEVPRWRLKMAQRKILRGILEQIPVHWRVHGFCRGRSTRSFVEPHVGQDVVLRVDLKDFFPSIHRSRVRNLFRTAGYPFEVASLLAALCTNWAPNDVWSSFPQYGTIRDRWRHEQMFSRPHLPQGAPSSPAIANFAAYRLDCRLFGLARSLQARYTRYADDLLFSGGAIARRSNQRLLATISAIVQDEGFQLNVRKTRVMNQSMRQAAVGLTINRHVNIDRRQYDQLKATLYNCARRGPAGQNHAELPDFRAHLHGRVAYVERVNPVRGKRLRALYERIDWA